MLYICSLNRFIMESIRLEFQPNIKAKIMEVLSSFSSDELKIVQEDLDFDENNVLTRGKFNRSFEYWRIGIRIK